MTTELAVMTDPSEIDKLDDETRAQFVTNALVESKSWLAVATKGTDPKPIAEFRAWAAIVAEATKQRNLAAEIQLDAQEMVRRAERGIGQAVRNGQEAGTIAKRGSIGGCGVAGALGAVPGSSRQEDLGRPADYLPPGGGAMSDTYAMTDDVTDEQFDTAIGEAKAEGNLSRANVVRKVNNPGPSTAKVERLRRIAELAAKNYTSRQIAGSLGIRSDVLSKLAAEAGIDIPADRVVPKGSRRIDPERIVRETVIALEGIAMGLRLLDPGDLEALDQEQVIQWSSSLAKSVTAITKLKKELNRVRV